MCNKRQAASIARSHVASWLLTSEWCNSPQPVALPLQESTSSEPNSKRVQPLPLPSSPPLLHSHCILHVNITCALIRTTLSNSIHASRTAAPALRHAIPVGRLLCTSSLGTGDAAVGQGCISAGNNSPSSFPPTLPLLKVPEQIAPRGAEVPAHQEDSNPSGGRWEGGAHWK